MSLRELELPPRNLIALIVGITAVSLAVLSWLGWRLLEQDRQLESQQEQQRLERAADAVAAALHRALDADQQRLSAGAQDWPAGAVALVFRGRSVEAYPRERVAYLPVTPPLREAPTAKFAHAEEVEFRGQNSAETVALYEGMSQSPDTSVRAGALLRLARCLRASGRFPEALAAYGRLAHIDGVSVGGFPAGLAARYARCRLLEERGLVVELRTEARTLLDQLYSAQWALTGPVYWLHTADAVRWSGAPQAAGREEEAFAEATDILWRRRDRISAATQESISAGDESLTVLWHPSQASIRALIAAPRFAESRWLAPARAAGVGQNVTVTLGSGPGSILKVIRRSSDTGLPWDITVVNAAPLGTSNEFALRRRLLIYGFVVLVVLAITASYLIFRAVSRELAVVRMKSEFVAAVSHEFRTPLTALRQFTDMLRENANLPADRRRICHDAQSRATERLTRLVEALLDFGRIEAGARRYHCERRDCAKLVECVVEEFRPEAKAADHEIAFTSTGTAQIDADQEALSRAVWNLLDNAVKYSPDHPTVEVGVARANGSVSIAVRDHGIGIPPRERAALFRKFVRGEEASKRGIRGTGIGLAMAHQIVKAHQGKLDVESEPGRGSTFTIVLPVRE
jgi:signal transduction histidine kinase